MKHEDEGGKNSEVKPIVYIQTSKLKSNENNSDLNLQGTLLSNHDKTSTANLIDLTKDHVWFEDRWMVASWCDE
jgi:hypothetical protein